MQAGPRPAPGQRQEGRAEGDEEHTRHVYDFLMTGSRKWLGDIVARITAKLLIGKVK